MTDKKDSNNYNNNNNSGDGGGDGINLLKNSYAVVLVIKFLKI